VRRRSKRTTRGRAPAPPDSDVGGTQKPKGKKRAADGSPQRQRGADPSPATQPVPDDGDDGDDDDDDDDDEDDEENEKMDDATPRKSGRARSSRRKVQVIVHSPPHVRPKQRLRKNEAGDAINVSDTQEVEEVDWVGTGAVRPIIDSHFLPTSYPPLLQLRCKECTERQFPDCVPQWGTVKMPTACVYCAGRRKVCVPAKGWLKMVERLHPAVLAAGAYISATHYKLV